MIMVRIYQLAPYYCDLCQKFHYLMRGQEPVIACLRCGAGACPTCYTREETPTLKKWKYICQGCESVVENDMGFGKLDDKDWDQAFDKKKGKANPIQMNNTQAGDVFEEEPEKTTEENEVVIEVENLEDDEIMAAAAAKVQGKKTDKKKVEEAPKKNKKIT